METPADVMRIARQVVDILYTACDYRGRRPVKAQLTYESRGKARLAYDSFTPEDLARIMEVCGFKVEEASDDEDAPVLRAVRRGIVTSITCDDRVPDQRLFQRAILTTDLDLPPEDFGAITEAVRAQIGEPEAMHLGTSLVFDGGVTVQRILDWDAMTWTSRREARRRTKGVIVRKDGKVH